MKWFSFKPVDTLFFRGAKPMVMGEDHVVDFIFPPPSFTIEGALRTAYLLQKGIDFKKYNDDGFNDQSVIEQIGRSGENPPFSVLGPFFEENGNIFVPVPYHWFYEKDKSKCEEKKLKEDIKIVKGDLLSDKFSDYFVLNDREIFYAVGSKLEPLGGNFVKLEDLFAESEEKTIYKPAYFFVQEQRTGIALDTNRTVRTGHLYSFTHARLKEDVNLIFGTTRDLDLKDEGELQLGAEQRFGKYKKIDIKLPENNGQFFMSLSLIKADEKSKANILATGKIQYFGGWDLKRGFHKPLCAYYPAGSIFKERFNDNLISIN